MPGVPIHEQAELAAARKRIAELEAESAGHGRATEPLGRPPSPKVVRSVRVMAGEGHCVQRACRTHRGPGHERPGHGDRQPCASRSIMTEDGPCAGEGVSR
ncbi:hypothetical protein C1I97_04675 [Streptomyces sp. NTH33]|nr:hypothetical protein C1I97_04675 [Streptomyces sp. NTH33]